MDYEEDRAPERTPPHDLDAEQSLLGACMYSAHALGEVMEIVQPDDFYRPSHGVILAAMAAMHTAGQPVDPITLGKYLADQGLSSTTGGSAYLFQLVNVGQMVANAGYHAEIVVDRALRRALVEHGIRTAQDGYGTSGVTFDLVEQAVARAREIRDRGQANSDLPTMDIIDFVQVEDSYDWLVPGLLERGDRLILTASEGGGKSTLLRQLAVTVAAGLHPFETWKHTDPHRVTILDCENGAPASRRKFRPLLNSALRVDRPVARGQLHIECRPEGLDLTRPADRAWMMRRVERLKPELLIVGPIYRLHAGDPNSEELARKVSTVIDEARATAGCTVIMEAHAPHHNGQSAHRNLRPLGSSLWMRWPEFGFGLRPVEDEKSAANTDGCRARRVIPWRGMRDERAWPAFIRQGEHWPWISYTPIDADPYTGYSATGAIV
ncbi:DnaB-like helicase N-terminal domain-containing protein [Streptomyces sp. NPDC021224]|uniref:DnaB-like helicase N-terminal domain-containing protein n=1 Tax=unclassified Streptomyces TaxID=2593676 RepID=UPI0037A004F3